MSIVARLERLSRDVAALRPVTIPSDPVALMDEAGITPDPWQAAVLRSNANRILLNCSRQAGKSTVTAGLAVYTALSQSGSLTLLLSPSQRQSAELLTTCARIYGAVGRPVVAEQESTLQLRLANGSRVIALPGKEATIRGYSGVALLVVDEASRVQDGLYYSIRPMLAVSGGRLVALSTPFGKRGWWYEAWTEGGDTWERVLITAHECPRISAAFLEEERASLPAMWFRQEYLGEFAETTDQVFSYEQITAALSDEVVPLFGGGI
jgi:hypothetical protein